MDFDDEFLWSKNPTQGLYTPKVGWKVLCEGEA
jgi:hypothetical protein